MRKGVPIVLTLEEMADIILQTDKAKSDAAVDAMSEADAKKMLKRMLSTVHRLHWPQQEPFSTK